MNVYLRALMILLVGLSLSAPALAQQDPAQAKEPPKMRAKTIKDSDSSATVARPDGWVLSKPGKGVIATFHAAGDSSAQIEVRVSPHVKDKQGEIFFTSFHASLQKAGFSRLEVRKASTYASKIGLETEYKTTAKKQEFRLIVWQYQHDDAAYLVVGFFPAKARDKYYADFQQVIESLKVD